LSVSSTISESNNNTRIAAGTYAANNKRRESSAKVNFEIPLYHEDMVEQESDSHLRSEARWGTFVNLDHNDQKYNREELCILSRVEGALRKLEKENLDGKSRESLFLQEIADLKDALRVHAAEKTRMEDEVARLSIEKEEWKLEAHRSATAMNQLQEELAIAKEEAKLLHGENIRLKHQNKELTTHVFRLDTLVYGKF
jgi:chromosome segregation ATPase